MGLGPSKEEELDLDALLSTFGDSEQRVLLRNFQMLASRSPPHDAFSEADWHGVHSAMAPRLATAIFQELSDGSEELITLHTVARVLVRAHREPAMLRCGDDDVTAALAQDALDWMRHSGATTQWEAERAPASIIAAAVKASVLLDHRSLQPLPQLTDAEGSSSSSLSSSLLPLGTLRTLSSALTLTQRRQWRLLYSSARDGRSWSRLAGLVFARAPCLIAMRDCGGATFGAFAPEPLRKVC